MRQTLKEEMCEACTVCSELGSVKRSRIHTLDDVSDSGQRMEQSIEEVKVQLL